MTTLHNLQSLLSMALTRIDNPALSRCERTGEGVARVYLPGVIPGTMPHGGPVLLWPHEVPSEQEGRIPLRMTDPGTAHALLVALALAKGLDPGPCALDVGWRPFRGGTGRCGWMLATASMDHVFLSRAENCQMVGREIFGAPPVAIEPNPIAALEAAVKHTLEQL